MSQKQLRAVPDAEAAKIGRLYHARYFGFTAKHFHEHPTRGPGFSWGDTWTKTNLQSRGLLAKALDRDRGVSRIFSPR